MFADFSENNLVQSQTCRDERENGSLMDQLEIYVNKICYKIML